MKRTKLLRILAAVTGCVLLGILIFLYIGFNGNPVSQLIAGAKIRNYVKDTYPDTEYEVASAQYNFKTGGYSCRITNPNSPDSEFLVSYGGGQIRDDYEYYVTERQNTAMRIENELETQVEQLIRERYTGEYRLFGVHIRAEQDLIRTLELDVSYTPEEFPLPVEVVIWTGCEEQNWEILADKMLELDGLIKELGVPVQCYSMSLEAPYYEDEYGTLMPEHFDSRVNIYEFPAEKVVDSPQFAAELKAHREAWERAQEQEKEQEIQAYESATLIENNS